MAPPLTAHSAPSRAGWLLALLPLAVFLYLAAQIPAVLAGETLQGGIAWVPSLGIALSFQLDGLSLLFALLVSGIGALIVVYAGGYLAGHAQLGRFYAVLLLFTTAMLGVVCAGDAITLFIFWELTSITSYLLIGFDHERAAARAAALQALLVTGAGGLALLAGLVLLGQVGGGYEWWRLTAQSAAIHASPLYLPILILVLAGAFTKSAQVPFHFWLPGAMEAPTPVSAYLHSATMVKVGVYLVARLHPVLGGAPEWHYTITLAGATTMLTGAVLALGQRDLKRLLAYTTISALGTLMLLLGLGTTLAVQAAFFSPAKIGIIKELVGSKHLGFASGIQQMLAMLAILAGQIVRGDCSVFGASENKAILVLTPVPEPASYAMLLAGLAGLAAYSRRRQKR